jgi:hypothetical protein
MGVLALAEALVQAQPSVPSLAVSKEMMILIDHGFRRLNSDMYEH